MLKQSDYFKILVTVPVEVADKVRSAMAKAGAGQQGDYDSCSFSSQGIGRFRPLKGAQPAIGEVGKLEEVAEETITTICHNDLLPKVVAAIKAAHPYEEPTIDIVPRFEIE